MTILAALGWLLAFAFGVAWYTEREIAAAWRADGLEWWKKYREACDREWAAKKECARLTRELSILRARTEAQVRARKVN